MKLYQRLRLTQEGEERKDKTSPGSLVRPHLKINNEKDPEPIVRGGRGLLTSCVRP